MSAPSETLTGFAGPAGVGAIGFLAVFLFLDGRNSKLLPNVEAYAKTSTWSVVAALPTLALIYVFGVVIICVSQLISQYLGHLIGIPSPPNPADILRLGIEKDSIKAQIFLKCYQEHEVLTGSGIALVLLGIGSLSERSNLPELSGVIGLSSAIVVIVGVLAFALSFSKANLAHRVAASVATLAADAGPAKDQAVPPPVTGAPQPKGTSAR